MSYSTGDQLGQYVITAQLGAGGMGEVYRARDARLGRDVAIKVLPNEVAADPERIARFEREAKLLASLNHTGIATLYGIETTPDPADASSAAPKRVTFLAMELVEGSDLAERIKQGPIPVHEAVSIAKQIAEGLEAAHGRGVVHRDLKPANIMLTAEGTAKILDFGLAKATEKQSADKGVTEMPTLTADLTGAGTTLGTAPYMSPEQALGKEVDRRTDIWAFGCVLYEMLTGRRAFPGNVPGEILAQILEREPDWSAVPSTATPALQRLLRRCLAKEPNRRLRDAGDVALALEDLDLETSAALSSDLRATRSFRGYVPWGVAALASAIAFLAWLGRSPQPPRPDQSVLRFTQTSPAPLDISRIGHSGPAVAVSPDGRILAWIGSTETGTQLFIRRLEEENALPIPDTEGALVPTFSPDSQWIAFWANGTLQKISVRGGVAQDIFQIEHLHGISWGDDVIVMGGVGDGTLWRVDPGSGEVGQIEIAGDPNYAAGYPRLLPGSNAMLVTHERTGGIDIVLIDSGEFKTVVKEGANAHYLQSGRLVWTQKDSLVSAPFDLSSLTISGNTYTVIEGVISEASQAGTSHYSVSPGGTLAYLPGSVAVNALRPTWVTNNGASQSMPLPADSSYLSPRVAPDGQRLLLSRQTTGRSIWLADSLRGIMDPLTAEETSQYWAIWTPDGSNIIFNSMVAAGRFALMKQPVDLSAPPTPLTATAGVCVPLDITKDGRSVLFVETATETGAGFDVNLLFLDGEPTVKPLLTSDANEFLPALSPDERWIAYASDVTGRVEVYVQPFPNPGSTVRISSNGGTEPIWSPDGKRIYYRSLDGRRIVAADVALGDSLRVEREQQLFEGRYPAPIKWGRKWDIHPDGERFLMLEIESDEPPDGIRVVVNWDAEIERLISQSN